MFLKQIIQILHDSSHKCGMLRDVMSKLNEIVKFKAEILD